VAGLHDIEKRATVAIFLGVITVFGVLTVVLKPPRKMTLDNRPRHSFHALLAESKTAKEFTRKLDSYITDRLAFRDHLIRLRNGLSFALLGDPGDKLVVAKRDGWMQYVDNANLGSFLNRAPFDQAALQSAAQQLEAKRQWLEKRGIRYLLVIAPDKATIYPESMPGYYRHCPGPTRLDQLLQYLRDHTDVQALDLRSPLRREAKRQLVYWKTDTHWNHVGSWVAYCAVVQKLHQWFPQIQQLPKVVFANTPLAGGLAAMTGLESQFTEITPLLNTALLWRISDEKLPPLSGFSTPPYCMHSLTVPNDTLPTAVVLHDSFFEFDLVSLLPSHFRRSLYVFTPLFPMQAIELEHPDIVIEEHVERYLQVDLPIIPNLPLPAAR
jgi:hypothetical protein